LIRNLLFTKKKDLMKENIKSKLDKHFQPIKLDQISKI
jgi:hypothetical protein